MCTFQGELVHNNLVFRERYVYMVVTKIHVEGHTSSLLQLEYVSY